MEIKNNHLGPQGNVSLARNRNLGDLRARDNQQVGFLWKLRNFVQHGYRGQTQYIGANLLGRLTGSIQLYPSLSGVLYRHNWASLPIEQARKLRQLIESNEIDVRSLPAHFGGYTVDYGVLSRRVVTDAGVNFLCDAFQGLATLSNMKYHGFGTGTTAEGQSQTALVTELTTQYSTDSTRPTGSQTEGGSTNVYRSVATLSPDTGGTIAITEHALFSATSGGTMWDRSVFTAVNLVAGSDSLQVTYDLTLAAAG